MKWRDIVGKVPLLNGKVPYKRLLWSHAQTAIRKRRHYLTNASIGRSVQPHPPEAASVSSFYTDNTCTRAYSRSIKFADKDNQEPQYPGTYVLANIYIIEILLCMLT